MVEIKKYAVAGNSQLLDGGAMFGNAPRELWRRWVEPDLKNRIPLACRSFLFELGDRRVLLETGIGAYLDPKMRERFGVQESEHCLLANLQLLGLTENDIDLVILSHLHFDHAGGLLPAYGSKSDQLHFPRARYLVSRKAFERSLNPHFRDRASFIPGLAEKLEASGRLVLVDTDTHPEIMPECIRFRYSDGHTPGQLHTVVSDNDYDYLFAGDLVPGTHWVHLPITMGYDRFAEKVIDEKKELYESMDLQRLRLLYTHDSEYVSSGVAIDSKGRYHADRPVTCLTGSSH